MATPKVSIIVPTYNRADMIADTIDSILNQTYKDFELIIVDNESTDNTEEVVKSYKDKRIRYFKHQNNGIIAVNRNYGTGKARGEYIAFCDDDDLWLPEKLEKQVLELDKDSQVGFVCNNEIAFDNKGEHGERIRSRLRDSDFTFDSLVWTNPVSCSTVLVRKAALDDVGVMDESPEIVTVEDYELWLRIAKKYRGKYINLPLGKHRTHRGAYTEGSIETLERDSIVYKKLLDNGGLSPELYQRRISKLNQQMLLLKFLMRTGLFRYALLIARALRNLKDLRRGIVKMV